MISHNHHLLRSALLAAAFLLIAGCSDDNGDSAVMPAVGVTPTTAPPQDISADGKTGAVEGADGRIVSFTLSQPPPTKAERFTQLRLIQKPASAPSGQAYQVGFFDFQLSGIPAGTMTTVKITLPHIYRAAGLVACMPSTGCGNYAGATVHDNFVFLNLADGGQGDADGLVNGLISSQVGPVTTN